MKKRTKSSQREPVWLPGQRQVRLIALGKPTRDPGEARPDLSKIPLMQQSQPKPVNCCHVWVPPATTTSWFVTNMRNSDRHRRLSAMAAVGLFLMSERGGMAFPPRHMSRMHKQHSPRDGLRGQVGLIPQTVLQFDQS